MPVLEITLDAGERIVAEAATGCRECGRVEWWASLPGGGAAPAGGPVFAGVRQSPFGG
jgi:hypothetical protein